MDWKVENSKLTVYVPRELDDHAAREIREQVDPVLESRWIRLLVFDFGKTAFMDSSGIGMILGRYKKLRCIGGKVTAVHASARIQRMLLLSGAGKVIQIEDGSRLRAGREAGGASRTETKEARI